MLQASFSIDLESKEKSSQEALIENHDQKMLTRRDDVDADPSGSSGSGSRDRCSDQVSVSVKRERGGEEAVEVERVWSSTREEREDDQDVGNKKKLRLSKEQSFCLEEIIYFFCVF
ncbi:hypothetical protein Droror1_Dr00013189 [Drosera rotundifolia]